MINSKLWRERWMGGGASHAHTHTHTYCIHIRIWKSCISTIYFCSSSHAHMHVGLIFLKIDFYCGRKAITNGWREGGLAELRKHTHTHTHTHTSCIYCFVASSASHYIFSEKTKKEKGRGELLKEWLSFAWFAHWYVLSCPILPGRFCLLSVQYFISHFHIFIALQCFFHSLFRMGESDYLDDNLMQKPLTRIYIYIYIYIFSWERLLHQIIIQIIAQSPRSSSIELRFPPRNQLEKGPSWN